MTNESRNIVLNLSTEDAFIHKDFYERSIREMEIEHEHDAREKQAIIERMEARTQRIKKYKEYLDRIDSQLNIGQPFRVKPTFSFEYHPAWSLSQKARYVLFKAGVELTTRSIVETILEHEPRLLEQKEITFDRLQKNLGSTLLQKVNNEIVFCRRKENENDTEWLYGLIEWDKKRKPPVGASGLLD